MPRWLRTLCRPLTVTGMPRSTFLRERSEGRSLRRFQRATTSLMIMGVCSGVLFCLQSVLNQKLVTTNKECLSGACKAVKQSTHAFSFSVFRNVGSNAPTITAEPETNTVKHACPCPQRRDLRVHCSTS